MKTITRADVAETIYEEIGLSRKDSGDILDMILDEMTQELVGSNDVKLSSFGTFALRNKKPVPAVIPRPVLMLLFHRAASFLSNLLKP